MQVGSAVALILGQEQPPQPDEPLMAAGLDSLGATEVRRCTIGCYSFTQTVIIRAASKQV